MGANIDGFTNAELTSFGSVIASPLGGGANCAGFSGTTSGGWNFDDDGSCGFGSGAGDRSDAGDPLLVPLALNGGTTETMLPQTGSPLLDAIPAVSCGAGEGISSDQVGTTRPQGSGCDIGAVERVVAVPAPPTPPAALPLAVAPKFTVTSGGSPLA